VPQPVDPGRRWLVRFAATGLALLAIAVWAYLRLPGYRDPAFDFAAMAPNQLFIVHGLTRRQEGSVKVGYAEAHPPPQVGLFGNHIAQYFGAAAFDTDGHPAAEGTFFNFWFANLALPEIQRYLLHLENLDHLPRRLILVQVTSPNIDNGQFIVNFGHELPPDLLLARDPEAGWLARRLADCDAAWQVVENWLHELLNYNTLILGLAHHGTAPRIVDPATCGAGRDAALPGWLRRMPLTVREILAESGPDSACQASLWSGAFHRDGATDPAYAGATLVKNEDPLVASERGLAPGDERAIAEWMRAIDRIGRRHAIPVAFVLPPAYESDRDGSAVNRIFNQALALAPELTVIDDRGLRGDASQFVDYLHPSPRYFRGLVERLRARGLLARVTR